MEEVKASWFDGTEDDDQLVRELLDDESPLFFPPEDITQTKLSPADDEQAMNQLISTFYSGPTIQDIENALSITGQKDQSLEAAVSQARIAMLERRLSKMENKYTLKLKSCGDGMADDGYKWRKYGQKSIKNSPYPRSYYRCTNPRCSAKKQVERSREDNETLVITYEGLHLHFAYPYFLLDQPHRTNSSANKKPKKAISGAESKSLEAQEAAEEAEESLARASPSPSLCTLEEPRPDSTSETIAPQGLLEDVVPFMIRNPSANISSLYSSSSSSSYRSPSPSPSSLSRSSNNYRHSCFDIGIKHW